MQPPTTFPGQPGCTGPEICPIFGAATHSRSSCGLLPMDSSRSPVRLAIALTIAMAVAIPAALSTEPEIVTRQAVCRRADRPPVLDGKLDDPCWKEATVIDRFASFWDRTPRAGTKAYLTWDDEALYYAATMTDAELRAYGTR